MRKKIFFAITSSSKMPADKAPAKRKKDDSGNLGIGKKPLTYREVFGKVRKQGGSAQDAANKWKSMTEVKSRAKSPARKATKSPARKATKSPARKSPARPKSPGPPKRKIAYLAAIKGQALSWPEYQSAVGGRGYTRDQISAQWKKMKVAGDAGKSPRSPKKSAQ